MKGMDYQQGKIKAASTGIWDRNLSYQGNSLCSLTTTND
jgi:hypothetical protein